MTRNYQVLQANWIHPRPVERWLEQMKIGRTLNVCCGMSKVGDVRVDIESKTNRTHYGDLFNLQFEHLSFDTVICDPPFDYYVTGENRFRWIARIADLCRKRLILSMPALNFSLGRKWARRLFYTDSQQFLFLRLFWVFDRRDEILT